MTEMGVDCLSVGKLRTVCEWTEKRAVRGSELSLDFTPDLGNPRRPPTKPNEVGSDSHG
jgi:hypothetical protein